MAEPESDGIAEVFDEGMRLAITAAGRLAERRIREREQEMRDAQTQSEQTARELQARIDAERRTALAQLEATRNPEWWDHASVDDVASAWEAAQEWRDRDSVAEAAAERMRPEIIERYGLDPEQVGVQADDAAGERAQRLEATAIVGAADRGERAEALDYDSAERRARTSEVLSEAGVAEDVVESHRLADTSQALPASEAVTDAPRRGPRARRSPASSRRRDIRRDRGR
jgi:colicin import membrane protein